MLNYRTEKDRKDKAIMLIEILAKIVDIEIEVVKK
jgi:hypothetical protein